MDKKQPYNVENPDREKSLSTYHYLGTGWLFPPAFVKNEGIEMTDNEEDIRESLHILFVIDHSRRTDIPVRLRMRHPPMGTRCRTTENILSGCETMV